MRFLMVTVSTVGLLLLVASGADAQSRTLSLEQAIASALESNLNILQAQHNVEAAQAGALAARGSYLPTVSASGGWRRSQNDSPSSAPILLPDGRLIPGASGFRVDNYFSTGIDVNYTLFDGFRREGNLGRATSNAIAAEHSASRTRQTIVYRTESAYINVWRNEQLVRVSEENLKRDRRQLERITESNKVGALSLADVYRQQSQVSQDELALIRAQNEYDKSKADLVALIGLDVSAEYRFADPALQSELNSLDVQSGTDGYSFEKLSQRAMQARPDYLGFRQTQEGASSGVSAARAGYLPSVSAFGGYSLSNSELSKISDNSTVNWGLSLRWNIFDGFQTNQSLESAIATRRNAEVALKQAERDIHVDIRKALLDHEAARKALEASQKGLLSAQEDRRIAEERYNLGAGTLLDLLTANAGLVSAEANKINSAYSLVIARRNIEYVVGERSY